MKPLAYKWCLENSIPAYLWNWNCRIHYGAAFGDWAYLNDSHLLMAVIGQPVGEWDREDAIEYKI